MSHFLLMSHVVVIEGHLLSHCFDVIVGTRESTHRSCESNLSSCESTLSMR